MTPDPRDEFTTRFMSLARITWDDEVAFLLLDPAEAERPGIQRGPLGQPLAWDNSVTIGLHKSKWRQEPT